MDKVQFAPIELTLYNDQDEAVKTFTKSVVRWGILKKAIKLAKALDKSEGLGDDDFDAISSFICHLFDDQFTVAELENGADVSEIMTCFHAVVRRANTMGNV